MRQVGLTVVEVMVALVIIGVAFAALAAAQITNIRVTRDSKMASIATQVANQAMERAVSGLLAVKSDSGQSLFDCDVAGFACEGTYDDIRVEGVDYLATYSVVLGAVAPGLAEVHVEVAAPAAVGFDQLVSCMDVVPPPSFANPAPCPAPAGG